ncbi:MAG: RNA-binding S4 domain-containing protein [Veillonellaceae bacterium]|nr:RNA-binding S4 domain-containing protein [Veillonellaceae bacterium]
MQEEQVQIHTDYIQLDQLLKLANVIQTGGQIRPLLDEEAIQVDNQICREKRKKIRPGQVVVVNDQIAILVKAQEV